jgi:hypothetical protein
MVEGRGDGRKDCVGVVGRADASRRAGEILEEMGKTKERAVQGRPDKRSGPGTFMPKTLSDLGFSRKQASVAVAVSH